MEYSKFHVYRIKKVRYNQEIINIIIKKSTMIRSQRFFLNVYMLIYRVYFLQ